jgi:hypothetical protein
MLRNEIHKFINYIPNKEELADKWKEPIIEPITERVLKLAVLIIVGYHCYHRHAQFYSISFPNFKSVHGFN